MRAIMIMYDSLNRRSLPNYGNSDTVAPNFDRLSDQTVCFDNFYVGSLPCIPARRDLHTGRYSFLHRSWGPVEPFDNSVFELLQRRGIYTHLITDHYHYWEDGGATYHTRYSSCEMVRGQEADAWRPDVAEPEVPEHVKTMREFTHPKWWRDSWHNRKYISDTNEWPQSTCCDRALEFLDKNSKEDNWFLQVEMFDPHEPFDSPEEFKNLYSDEAVRDEKVFDWPPYAPVTETEEQIRLARRNYKALVSMCDKTLGRLLDKMDELNLWEDTLLIVNTDHGFLLGEKEWWAKSVMPCYNEIAHTPFFIWDPRYKLKKSRSNFLAQTTDIAPTLLDYFGLDQPKEMTGVSISKTLEKSEPIHDSILFGFHGSFVNIVFDNYLYMRASARVDNSPLYEYTVMPTHQQGFFGVEDLAEASLHDGFSFTKGAKVLKIPVLSRLKNATFCNSFQYGNLLWDLKNDPEQEIPVDDLDLEARAINLLIEQLIRHEAPDEQFFRLGLDKNKKYEAKDVAEERRARPNFDSFDFSKEYEWADDVKQMFMSFLGLVPKSMQDQFLADFGLELKQFAENNQSSIIDAKIFENLVKKYYSDDPGKNFYFVEKLKRKL